MNNRRVPFRDEGGLVSCNICLQAARKAWHLLYCEPS